jgi:hypothetical protein
MGISNQLSLQLDSIFNRWTKVKVTDPELLRLIQLAMVPNKEVLDNIEKGQYDELSTCFNNMCNSVFEYAMSSPTQQTETTRGTLFGAYNAVTGYFQNVRNYKDERKQTEIPFIRRYGTNTDAESLSSLYRFYELKQHRAVPEPTAALLRVKKLPRYIVADFSIGGAAWVIVIG